ncbi:MAG TPA: DMT family transporter [Ignavibacteria bacterium]|nr:DMT family transporter [Ignavibacteria bacterium]
MTRIRAELILLFIATLWAGTFPVIKISVDTIPPFLFISVRFFIAAVLFSLIYFRSIPLGDTKALKAGLLLAVFQMTGFGSQTLGMVYTSASNSALITGICILFVPFVQYLVIKKSPTFENWIGVAVVTIGLFLLTQPFELGFNNGDLITLICTLSWAFYIVLLDPFSKKYNINVLIFVQFWFVAIVSILISLTFESYSGFVLTSTDYYAIAYMGIAATLITTTLGNRYQKFTTPIRASIIFTWEQPAAVTMAIIFLGETFGTIQIIGGVLMIAGILFSETYEYFRTTLNNKIRRV